MVLSRGGLTVMPSATMLEWTGAITVFRLDVVCTIIGDVFGILDSGEG